MTATRLELPPVVRTVTVPWTVEAAFRRFTTDLATWWPLRTHSVGQAKTDTVVFEARTGGRVIERLKDGTECDWGTVVAWEPPRRVAFTWHPGRAPAEAGDVEVRFEPEGAGTRVTLTHGGWERLGRKARVARRGYHFGWAYVLDIYAGQTSSLTVRAVHALGVAVQFVMTRKGT